MKKLLISIIFLIIFTNCAFALECQYTKDIINSTETKFLPFNNEGVQLKEIQVIVSPDWNKPAKIINPNDEELKIKLLINLKIKQEAWCSNYETKMDNYLTNELTIPGKSFIELPVTKPTKNYYCKNFQWTEPYEIQYQSSNGITVKLVDVEHKIKICAGKDDGEKCSSSNECGGNHCVEGQCSNTKACFNNNCKCSYLEFQSADNTKCEKNKLFFGLILLGVFLIIGVIVFTKAMIEKRRTYEKEIMLLRERQDAILRKENELNRLKKLSSLTEIEKEKIKRLYIDIQQEVSEMEREVRKKFDVFMKPYPSEYASGRLVFRNPYLNGYECFYEKRLDPRDYDSSKLVHRWVWKKHNGSWPKPGYHIHHKDNDKYNNDPKNLQELSGEEHFNLHRKGRY